MTNQKCDPQILTVQEAEYLHSGLVFYSALSFWLSIMLNPNKLFINPTYKFFTLVLEKKTWLHFQY